MNKVTIRQLIGLLVATALAVNLVLAVMVWRDLQLLRKALSTNETVLSATLKQSYQVRINSIQVRQWLTKISATRARNGLDDGFAEASKAYDQFQLNIERLLALDPANKADYQAIQPLFETYYRAGTTMAQAYIEGGPQAGNLHRRAFDQAAAEIDARVSAIQRHIDMLVEQDINLAHATIGHYGVKLWTILVVLMAVILLIAFSVVRWILLPFEQFTRALEQFSRDGLKGDLQAATANAWNYRELQRFSDAFGSLASQLSLSEQENKALLTNLDLHLIISVADRAGRITRANDAFCRISGYERNELVGHNHRIIRSDEQSAEFWTNMWKTISSGSAWRGQVRNRAKDGSHYWVDTHIAPVIGLDGKVEKYIAVRFDITKSKAGEQALIEASAAAQSASLAKGQFLANMSHELRTPMNAVLGMLTLLRKTKLTARQADYAAKSDGAARSLLNLLNEILDFSKIEAGKMALDPHPFALDQLLREVSVILGTGLVAKPVELLFDIDPLIPSQLVGDAMRIKQILLNLGSNALKFTPLGEVILAMRVIQRSDAEVRIQFSLSDTGIGIALENQARIFSGFSQAESSTTRMFGGTGLGLVISQCFVELMGGVLEVDSTVGVGSRFFFTVSLPIANQEFAPIEQLEDFSADQGPCRVLLIDDNTSARRILKRMGRSLGWSMDLASTGEQALQILQQQGAEDSPYQIILVDWTLAQLGGWDSWQQIRQVQTEQWQAGSANPALLLLMVSAHEQEQLLAGNSNAETMLGSFVVKPITAGMLRDAVKAARIDQNPTPPVADLPQPASPGRLEGMHILLVEDNSNNQQVACELLEYEGARVQIAHQGAEAVAVIAAAGGSFDAVLMDVQMPVMDGFEATRRIRRDLGQTDLPIVAMTANVLDSDRQACLAAGMNSYIGKPFGLDELVAVLRAQVSRQDATGVVGKAIAPVANVLSSIAQTATEAGVDLSAALERMGGMEDLYRRMLATFVADLQTMPGQLHTFAQNPQQDNNLDDAVRLLHTLKGLAATMGATELSTAAASAEQAILKSTGDQHALIYNQASTAIVRALPGLQALSAVV